MLEVSRSEAMSLRSILPLSLMLCCVILRAQEIKFIDLASTAQRTELRYPPAPPPDCKKDHCVGGGYGGSSIGDGAPDRRDPHALGVYLLRVTPTDIDPAEPFEAEFQVFNTGLDSMELPVSPHLSDLQPSDESATFSYLSLALVVHGEGEPQRGMPFVGFVELYGSPNHEDSTVVLRPGEWIRVRASVKFRSWPSEPASTRLRGDFWLRRNTFHPHPGGLFTEMQNLYPNATPTPWIAVHLLRPASSKGRK